MLLIQSLSWEVERPTWRRDKESIGIVVDMTRLFPFKEVDSCCSDDDKEVEES